MTQNNKILTLVVTADLLEEQSCQISSPSDLKQGSQGFFKESVQQELQQQRQDE